MHGRIVLLVLEDGKVRSESAQVALELSRRLDASLAALVLCGQVDPGAGEPGCREALAALTSLARGEGVEMEAASVHGHKASELLKFLAVRHPVSALVWGGSRQALRPARARSRHWFARIRDQIHCPIIAVPTRRAR